MSQLPVLRYQVVDVFTRNALEGNALAVFIEPHGIGTETMQKIAAELNLCETVFVTRSQRPDCIARLRIFTPRREMDFAGHPTIGSGFVLLQAGYVPEGETSFAVEENVGVIPLAIEKPDQYLIWLRTPPIRDGATVSGADAAALVGLGDEALRECAPQVLNAGNPTLFVALREPSDVDRAVFDSARWTALREKYRLEPMCVFVFAPTPAGAYSRMFAPDYGVPEDPATGSSTGPLASYMMRHGLVSPKAGTRFVSEQGTRMGRRSLLHVHLHGDQGSEGIDVGGFVTPIIQGELRL